MPIPSEFKSTPAHNDKVSEMMSARKSLQVKLLSFQDEHSEIFEVYEELISEIGELETRIKDAVRAMYHDGSPRGIFELHKDDMFQVKATVKYGKDAIDPDELRRRFGAKANQAIVAEEKVDVEKLKDLISAGDLPIAAMKLAKHGKFHTPSVSIRNLSATGE